MGRDLQALPDFLRQGIDPHVQECRDNDQDKRLIQLVITDGTVYEMPESVDTKDTKNRRLTHDHLPTIEQKGQELAITAGQDFIEIPINPIAGRIEGQMQQVDVAGSKICQNTTIMQEQGEYRR